MQTGRRYAIVRGMIMTDKNERMETGAGNGAPSARKTLLCRLWQSELVRYLIIGGLTTLVSLVTFWLFGRLAGLGSRYPQSAGYVFWLSACNVLSWICAVAFAYVTNKLFVFRTRGLTVKEFWREIALFVGDRVASLLIEEAGLVLLTRLFVVLYGSSVSGFGGLINGNREMIAKLIMQVGVIIVNYIFSKLVIFRKKP